MKKRLTTILSAMALCSMVATASETVPADTNGDGVVNKEDATLIYSHILGTADTTVTSTQVDVNGDGKVNTADVVEVYKYIKWRIDGYGQDSGDMTFGWDYTEDTGEKEMVMAFMNSGLLASNEGKYHTYATINQHSRHTDDAHWAEFMIVEKYEHDMPSNRYDGYKVIAVTPYRAENASTVASSADTFSATLPMPDTFTQVADQEPDFLHNYMYMYATSTITGGGATLEFNHIPAIFRFIVTNKRPNEANIKSIQISLVDTTQPVASKSATVIETGTLAFSSDTYTTITTLLDENGTFVETDAQYTAYALALPLTDNNAFNGKKIKFTIATDSEPANEYLSFVLDGALIEGANRTLESEGTYNWVSGKSYTIRMSLSDVLTFDGITVTDWADGGTIDGGVAEEE